jgi:hypothetical protein
MGIPLKVIAGSVFIMAIKSLIKLDKVQCMYLYYD